MDGAAPEFKVFDAVLTQVVPVYWYQWGSVQFSSIRGGA